ncbi:uncharacterized protein LOC113744935 [Larimichthys crocea]|uniref:uncharacterized protein LOC113744935 n=1 Tax=Larimichthys crocea TaxID=215358 RepID=UPI000F5E3E91|nr:uncharacterized protein LOC113744935 [Larimichthys crocea]
MKDGPTSTSAGGSSKGTVAGGTQSFGSQQKTKKEPKPLSDSDSTVILDLSHTSVPVFTRTEDSVIREMLEYTVEDSLSSSDVTEEEYFPDGETEIDSSAEEEREVQQTHVQPRKMAPSCSLAAHTTKGDPRHLHSGASWFQPAGPSEEEDCGGLGNTFNQPIQVVVPSVLAQRLSTYLEKNKYVDTSVQKAGIPGFSGCLEHTSMIWHQIQAAKKDKRDLHVIFP